MVEIRRRRMAVLLLALTVTVTGIGAALLVLRHERLDARADTAALVDRRAVTERDLDRLRRDRHDLREQRQSTLDALLAAIDRVERLGRAEAEAFARLEDGITQRVVTAANLDAVRVDLDEAAQQAERNDAVTRALERCLDGTTRAGNALSVGDVGRALGALRDVRAPCAEVGVVVGP